MFCYSLDFINNVKQLIIKFKLELCIISLCLISNASWAINRLMGKKQFSSQIQFALQKHFWYISSPTECRQALKQLSYLFSLYFFFFFNPLIMLCVKSVEIKVDGSLGFINEQSMNFISFTETFSRGKCNLFHFSVGKLSFKLYILFNFWAVKWKNEIFSLCFKTFWSSSWKQGLIEKWKTFFFLSREWHSPGRRIHRV